MSSIMKSDEYFKQYKNLLEADRLPNMFKTWNPLLLNQKDQPLSPEELKMKVLNSPRINKLLDEVSNILA